MVCKSQVAKRAARLGESGGATSRVRRASILGITPWRRAVRHLLVLIVDDDPDARMIHAEVLRARGFRSIEADDGASAIELALATKPDVILMDRSMPGMSGVEAARQLKLGSTTSTIPIVLLTGYVAFGREAEPSPRDWDASITKPATAEDLVTTLRSVLVDRPPADPQL